MKIETENKILTQLLATAGVMLLIIQTGIVDGWTSPNIVRLTHANATISLTLSEASWLASYLKLGRFASVILIPMLIDLAGSKRAILYAFIPMSVGWILTMTAKISTSLYFARFLCGITYGLTYGCFPIYLGEISAPTLRGTFVAVATVGWPLGILAGTAGETHLHQVVSCTIYLVLCLFGMLLFAWLPESPYQLVKNKDLMKARESLAWYREHNHTDSEMVEIIEYVELSNKVTVAEKLKQLRRVPVRKAVVLVTLVFTCPQMCGVLNIIFYMEIILTNGKSYLIEPNEAIVYVNVILVVSAFASVNLIDKLGRRIILMVSMISMATGYVGLGLHYYLLDNIKVDPTSIQSLPIVSIILVIVAFSIAYAPVMSVLLGEMCPAGVKSTAAMIVIFISSFAGFIATLVYQPLIDAFGEISVFWMYALLMALMIPVFMLLLPETKGKSLQQIQNDLNKK